MPAKRAYGVDPINVVEHARTGKRRKDAPLDVESSSPRDVDMSDAKDLQPREDLESVRDSGMKIWNALKDSRSKEDDHQLSYEFMRLPSKRLYADYYTFIKRPICLEDIKSKLDNFEYQSLELVKHDFDTCFKNAKRYNQKGSSIWNDAKALQKLTGKEYEKITGVKELKEDHDIDVINHANDEGSGDEQDGDHRKKKPQSLTRVLKNRLTKLVEKIDDDGRVLSYDFMEPPDKKLYPEYYKVIKRVMCFETIFRKIKRKEYSDAADFASDVELIFRNAFEFNVEHSPIWEDAFTLKEFFHKLMAALPSEFAVPAYQDNVGSSSGKIKLKLGMKTNAPANDHATDTTVTSLKFKLPAVQTLVLDGPDTRDPTSTSAVKQDARSATTPLARSNTQSQPTLQATGTPLMTTKPLPTALPTPPSIGGRGAFTPKPNASVTESPVQRVATRPQETEPPKAQVTVSQSPAPTIPTKHPIQTVTLRTIPRGRVFCLDRLECVRMWSLRLGMGESSIKVSAVAFAPEDEEAVSGEDEEEAADADIRLRRKSTGNARMKAKAKDRNKEANESDAKQPPEAIVKLNGSTLKSSPASKDDISEWIAELPSGTSIVEVTSDRVAAEIWRIYLDRQTVML